MRILLLLLSLTLIGCTSIEVEPVRNDLTINDICIVENKKVQVSNFVSVVQDRLRYHHIASKLIQQGTEGDCEYILRYTALRSWDIVPYLYHAEIELYNFNVMISKGIFHLNGKGGLALSKFANNHTKMNPVIDKMLNKEQN